VHDPDEVSSGSGATGLAMIFTTGGLKLHFYVTSPLSMSGLAGNEYTRFRTEIVPHADDWRSDSLKGCPAEVQLTIVVAGRTADFGTINTKHAKVDVEIRLTTFEQLQILRSYNQTNPIAMEATFYDLDKEVGRVSGYTFKFPVLPIEQAEVGWVRKILGSLK
jgi:hypothetical protein